MMTIFNGMAVLIVRIVFVLLSYQILKTLNWRIFFTDKNYYMARWTCILLSITVGHLTGSFFLEIIELLQNIILSGFYS